MSIITNLKILREKNTRNSNHELLRLVAMYMIVLIHANMYPGRFCTGSIYHYLRKEIDYFHECGIILLKESPANKWTFKKR